MAAERGERDLFPDDLRIGDWLLQPSIDRLSRNGTTVHLRPQLTNLLVLLAAHAGRTVSKHEILSSVWAGQFVAESGMTRCIAELRQALGDDARDPKMVQTITKRGYRLTAPVARVEQPLPVEQPQAAPRVPDEPVGPLLTPSPAGLPVPTADGEGQDPPANDGAPDRTVVAPDRADGHPPAAGSPLRGRRPPPRAAALIVAGGLALVALTLDDHVNPVAAPSERHTVVLADVENSTGDPAFDQTLRLALAVHLGQAPFLRILPDTRVRASLGLMGRPPEQPIVGGVALELCRREDAALLLAGSISKLGSHYAVGLQAVACATGDSVGRELAEAKSKDEVLGALGLAAGRLRKTLGESRESLSKYDVPIARATTSSLEALKALSLGDVARDHSRTEDSLMYFRRATDLDPLFALAWARRGAAAHNLARAEGDERSGQFAEARMSFQKAFELRDRVSEPERFYILAHYYRSVLGDPDKALEAYTLWNRMYPGSSIPSINSASIRANLFGQYEAALADAREGVRLAPNGAVSNLSLVGAHLGTNRLPEARQALRDATARGVDNLEWHRLAFEMAVLDGDAAAMQEHIRWASRDAAATMVITGLRALAAASAGRMREARQLWPEAARAAARVGTPAARASVLLAQAEAEALLGNPRLAREAAGAALAVDPCESTTLSASSSLALAGDAVRAARLLDDLPPRSEPDTMSGYVWEPVARALAAAAAGRHAEARPFVIRILRFERGRYFRLVPLGVRAWVEQAGGRAPEAAAAFAELLGLQQVAPTSPWTAFARLGLARALRDAADPAGSLAAYDAAIEATKDGDQDAAIPMAARRERAALAAR